MERHYSFIGGSHGPWRVVRMASIRGEPLPQVTRLRIEPGAMAAPMAMGWCLQGVTSNERYVTRPERAALAQRQAGLGRDSASRAVLIPIRKSAHWWGLAQDERRKILEEDSRHIAIGMEYLPAIARRLHHCRDLSAAEPFDFLTWFEFATGDEPAFDSLLQRLRATHEWEYVEREAEVRLSRD